MDRSSFLQRVAGVAIAGAAGGGLLSAIGCSGSSSVTPSTRPWAELAKSLSGRLLRPGDQDFAALALPNNLRYANILPAGIALCANAADVSTSILWARAHGIPLIARSGGHSYAGYSMTRGLMIDVRNMDSFHFDPATGIATFGGGARNKDIFAQGRKHGIAVTHGRCENVGVAGLTLGGGVGFNMRSNGLTCDQLTATEIVTADGKIQKLGPSAGDRGLFWACRGAGGGNFGINTSFSFQTFAVGSLIAFDLRWTTNTERVFSALAAALEAAPTSLGCKISATLVEPGGPDAITVQLLGQFTGTKAELNDILHPVYLISRPASGFVKEDGYWDAQALLSELGAPAYFKERSRFFDQPIADSDAATIFGWLRRWPGTVKTAAFKMFQTGGRVNAVAPGATAFVHRNSRWLSSVALEWERDTADSHVKRSLEWQNGFYEAVVPLAKGGAYQNFIDPSLKDWQTAYYGANLAQLESIKNRVDPTGVFTYPEAIP